MKAFGVIFILISIGLGIGTSYDTFSDRINLAQERQFERSMIREMFANNIDAAIQWKQLYDYYYSQRLIKTLCFAIPCGVLFIASIICFAASSLQVRQTQKETK